MSKCAQQKPVYRQFDLGLEAHLSGRGVVLTVTFYPLDAEIAPQAEREPVAAVRDLIHGLDYESWLYETSTSQKAAEMHMKTVNQLFSWMTEMLAGSEFDEPMTLTQVVTRFTLHDMMGRDESEEEVDQVQLMIPHASKGLEFPVCIWWGWRRDYCRTRAALTKIISMKSVAWHMSVSHGRNVSWFLPCAKSVASMANWCNQNPAVSCWNYPGRSAMGNSSQSGQRARADAKGAKPSGESARDKV